MKAKRIKGLCATIIICVSFATNVSGQTNIVPEGALNGLFSVSATKKVYFSKGNLQYQASTNTWRFATNQWDFVGGTTESRCNFGNVSGSSNNNISQTYNGK